MVNARKLMLPFLLFLLSTTFIFGQNLNTNWRKDLDGALQQFLNCGSGEASPLCAVYPGKALNTVYKVNDFYIEQSGRYMTVSEILQFVPGSAQWTALGKPYDQKTLETAQQYANAKKAVVAVYRNAQGIGHVVLITPGELQPSGSWGLKVPNAASFFPTDPQRSFIDKSLSFAFAKTMMKDITIYARLY